MSGVAAGRLRHRARLQRRDLVQDQNTGEMIEGWVDVAEVWCSIEPLSAREFLAAGAEQSEVRAKVTMRYRAGLDANMRLVHRALAYQFIGVLPDAVSGLEHITVPVSEGVRVSP